MIILCPECNKKTVLENKFCTHCGCEIKQCAECGNVLKANVAVCDYCGFENDSTQKIENKEPKKDFREMQKQAERYCSDYKKIKKRFSILSTVLKIIAFIFVGVITIQLLRLSKKPESGEETIKYLKLCANVKSQTKTFFILFATFMLLNSFVSVFKNFIARLIVFKKMDTDKFDCQKYYNEILLPIEKERENQDNLLLAAPEAIGFLPLCLEKINSREKVCSVLFSSFEFLLWCFFWISFCVGCYVNAEAHINNSSFIFHKSFIIVIISAVLIVVQPFSTKTPQMKWLEKINT